MKLATLMALLILQNYANLINKRYDLFTHVFGIWQTPHPLHACLLAKLDRKTDRESVGNLHKHDMLHLHISCIPSIFSSKTLEVIKKKGVGVNHKYVNDMLYVHLVEMNSKYSKSMKRILYYVEVILHAQNSFGKLFHQSHVHFLCMLYV